jgi:hypothetical protein
VLLLGTWNFIVELESLQNMKRSVKERAQAGGVLVSVQMTLTGTNSSQWPAGTNLKGPGPLSKNKSSDSAVSRKSHSPSLSERAMHIPDAEVRQVISAESKRSDIIAKRLLDASSEITSRAGQPVLVERRTEEQLEADRALREILADLSAKRAGDNGMKRKNHEPEAHSISKRDTSAASALSSRRAAQRT